MHGWGIVVVALIAGLSGPAVKAAGQRSVVEEIIAAQNPCQGLRTTHFGITIGVDRLKDVRLDRATVQLDGDEVSIDLDGRLACETSPGATLSGDAAARIRTTAGLGLDTCAVDRLDVRLSDFGGTFGPILAALASTIEAQLRNSAEPRLRKACEDFRGRGY